MILIRHFCLVFILVLWRHTDARPRLISSEFGRFLEERMRLGVNKKGITPPGLDDTQALPAPILEPRYHTPVEYVPPGPQYNGNMGNGAAPKLLASSQQFRPRLHVAPNPNLLDAPGGLRTLSEDEKSSIATEFLVKYNYTSNQLSDKATLIKTMQRNYGLQETGRLDEPTVTAMLKPRCGVPEKPANFRLFPNRDHWTNKDVTYKIKGYTPDLSQCQVRNIFKRAFRVWEEVTDLTFKVVDSEDADILIYFGYGEHGDGYPFDEANGLLAHAFNPGTQPISGDSHFDESEFWTLGEGRVFDTHFGNANGDSCVFPFYFEGKTYQTCTSDGQKEGLDWCATTADYDRDGKWGFCPHEQLFTYGGNSDGDPCEFPFVFLGQSYDGCTVEGRSDGYRWCATTGNYDDDSKWGFCPDRAHGTTGGNANGAACKFPFSFQQNTYSDCTTQGRSDYRLWCATTDDYERDGQWGFCPGSGYSLFQVAAHEFGHAIGLDHSNNPAALMYPSYSYHANFELPDDDTRGARDLYGGPRTRPLPILELEKCGGTSTGGGVAVSSTTAKTSTTPSTTPTASSTTPTTSSPVVTTKGRASCSDLTKPKNICERPIDAVMLFQEETFVFQGPFYWRVSGKGTKSQKSVIGRISSLWPDLKCNIDAAYQRPYDGKLVFFKGSLYYVFDSTSIEPGYPRDVTTLGLPSRSVVDAVVYMQTRNPVTRLPEERTYYFVGSKVYRVSLQDSTVMGELDPSVLGETAWEGLPSGVDAAFREDLTKQYTDFIKGDKVYRFSNRRGITDCPHSLYKLFRCPVPKSLNPLIVLP